MADLPRVAWRRRATVRLSRLKREWALLRRERRERGAAEGAAVTHLPDGVRITATTVSALRAHLPEAELAGSARRLVLALSRWRAPRPGWSGRPGHLPGLTGVRISLPNKGSERAVVEVTVARPVPVVELLRAALPALDPWRPMPTPAGAAREMPPANPVGRQRYCPDLPVRELSVRQAGAGWGWSAGSRPVSASGVVGRALDDRQRAALRMVGAAVLREIPAAMPVEALAAVLAQLAMTGVVVHAPSWVEGMPFGGGSRAGAPVAGAWVDGVPLGEELAALLRKPLPGKDADPMEWEIRSVAQRSEALRALLPEPPSVSALLVSRRPDLVPRTLKALGRQTYPNLEIIIAMHGCELPGIESASFPASMAFGEVLGAATAMASGTLLTKVDDDDIYGPDHIWDLVLARAYSGATVVGKTAEFVHLAAQGVTVRRHIAAEAYTDAVAGGAMLLARGDLEGVGGWAPVARSVDRALLDRVLRAGGLVYSTHALGFIYVRHAEGHTWDPGVTHFLADPRRKWQGLPPYPVFG